MNDTAESECPICSDKLDAVGSEIGSQESLRCFLSYPVDDAYLREM